LLFYLELFFDAYPVSICHLYVSFWSCYL
jgi:hypothetical protein